MKIKVLFQGDSITDAGRDRNDIHDMGRGYPKYTSAMLTDAYPDVEFEFVNLGISGNRTENLVARLQSDFIDIKPDLVIMMIGVNDTWHNFIGEAQTTNEQFETNLRTVLTAIRDMGAKLFMIEPYMLYGSDKEYMIPDLDNKIRMERKMAQEFADAYLPLHGILAAQTVNHPFTDFSGDGVHPNEGGAAFIAQQILGAIDPIIASLTSKD